MSLEQAKAFIEKMKSDKAFSESILATGSIEKKLTKCKSEGFDCTLEDFEALHVVNIDPQIQHDNLPLTWQCKGPCHTKCADVVA